MASGTLLGDYLTTSSYYLRIIAVNHGSVFCWEWILLFLNKKDFLSI
jgi:hypothetical protein